MVAAQSFDILENISYTAIIRSAPRSLPPKHLHKHSVLSDFYGKVDIKT
jgi:hypothetical protein